MVGKREYQTEVVQDVELHLMINLKVLEISGIDGRIVSGCRRHNKAN